MPLNLKLHESRVEGVVCLFQPKPHQQAKAGHNRPRLKITPVATTRTTTPEATTRMPLNLELHTHAPVWDGVKRAAQVSGNSVGA